MEETKEKTPESPNPYRAVEGTLPRKRDVQLWSHDRLMDFFRFVTYFMDGDVVRPTGKNRGWLETEMAVHPTHPWAEFMWRINVFTRNRQGTDRKFYYRLSATMRLIGMYVKSNPALMTDEMRGLLGKNPRLNWIIPHFKAVKTRLGPEVVVPDTRMTVGFQKETTKALNPEVSYMESMLKAANVFDMIVTSIRKSEIAEMTVKDKVNALSKLSFVFSQARNMKPNSQVFKQINVYKASKEELETAIMDFNTVETNEAS